MAAIALCTWMLPAFASTPLLAQTLHLYVDPVFGDDAAGEAALDQAITLAQQSLVPGSGVALPDNIAAPFRTVNGNGPMRPAYGAIPALAVRGHFIAPPQGGPTLWTHFVIHLLPGLYGPRVSGDADCHQPSGLEWNDDVFPIAMHNNISLQGMSALDTVLDARHLQAVPPGGQTPSPGSILVFREVLPAGYWANGQFQNDTWNLGGTATGNGPYQETFVDGLTLRGTWNASDDPFGGPLSGTPSAGIFIASETNEPLRPTISNCFITDNCAGVVILAVNLNHGFAQHEPLIHNCSIARNVVGLVDQDDNGLPGTGTGHSHAILLNNLFDNLGANVTRGVPPNQVNANVDLLGVDGELLRVVQFSVVAGVFTAFTQNGGYANAFVNRRVPASNPPESVAIPCWNGTYFTALSAGQLRPQLPAGSRLEFEPWTYLDLDGRFYVYQQLQDYDSWVYDQAVPTAIPVAGLRFGHDLRTMPELRHNGMAPAPPPGLALPNGRFQNPLMDQGLGPGPAGLTIQRFEFTPGTGYQLVTRGIAGSVVPPAPGGPALSGWDYDGEGFCNDRGVVDPVFGILGAMDYDIGADEVDMLIAGGFQQFTRQVHAGRPLETIEGTGIWFFGHAGLGLPLAVYQNAFAGWSPDCSVLVPMSNPPRPERRPLLPDLPPYDPNNAGRWYRVEVELPQVPLFSGPADWRIKPSLLPDVSVLFDPVAGMPTDPQWVLGPTASHLHAPGMTACNGLLPVGLTFPDTDPPEWDNAWTGGTVFDGNGVFLLGGLALGNPRWAQRLNFVADPLRNMQTALLRSTP